MNFNFGENLKTLRLSKKFTQEQVAEYLGVSAQSVSRWECGATMPDIMLLPQIARLFSTSTDELLGVNEEEKKKEIEKFFEQYRSLSSLGKTNERYILSKEMFEKCPNEKGVIIDYINSSRAKAFLDDTTDKEKEMLLENALSISKLGYETFSEIKDKSMFVYNISIIYYELEDKENAIKWAKKLPCNTYSSDNALSFVLEKEEKIKHLQYKIQNSFEVLLRDIFILCDVDYFNESTPYEYWERVEIMKKLIKFIELFFENGDYGFGNIALSNYNRIIAACYANCKMSDETIEYLEKSIKFAELADNCQSFKHTSLIVRDLEYDPKSIIKNCEFTERSSTLSRLENQERYDFLRENERFISIINRLKQEV